MAGTLASRRQLGALWSPGTVLKAGHHGVDSGPYRLVRHPTYASGIAMTVGTGLVFPTGWDALACLAVVAAYLVKMQHEERFLASNLPGYAEYRTRVRHRIVPGVW